MKRRSVYIQGKEVTVTAKTAELIEEMQSRQGQFEESVFDPNAVAIAERVMGLTPNEVGRACVLTSTQHYNALGAIVAIDQGPVMEGNFPLIVDGK